MTQSTMPVSAGTDVHDLEIDAESLQATRTVWNRCLQNEDGLDEFKITPVQLRHHWKQSAHIEPGRSDALVQDVTATAIRSGIGRRIMFHAAGLSDPDTGRTVALVAPSGTGKTTAVATLGQVFGYVTDETVIIDPATLAITPFPKPLSVLGPSGKRPKTLFSPDELGLLATPENPYLGAVVVLERDPRHTGDPQLQSLPLIEALGQLVPQTSSLSALDRGLVRLARTLDQTGGCHLLRYREISDASEVLRQLLQAAPEPAVNQWDPVELSLDSAQVPSLGGSVSPAPNASPTVRRAAVDDAITVGPDSMAVLVDDAFTVLRGLGPVLWEAVAEPQPLETLISDFCAAPDAPQDADQHVRKAVRELVKRGVLALDQASEIRS